MSSGRYELIGAVSWGRNCAKSYGVYADVPCKIYHFYFLVPGNCVIYSATISHYSLYFEPISDYRQWVTETVGTVYTA